MPDLFSVFVRWWKVILTLSLLAAFIAFIACIISPKKYLSTTTALPANSLIADKARIFNKNIEALYSSFGLPDELDKLEGTAALDTIFIAAAQEFNLPQHYHIQPSAEAISKAVLKLRRNSNISRSAYDELKIKVWDEDRNVAAALANSLMKKIQELHQHLQNENNIAVLQKLKEAYRIKQQQYKSFADSTIGNLKADEEISTAKKTVLLEQLKQYEKAIDEYELAVQTNPQVLLVVEPARSSLWYDKPKTVLTVLLTLAAALLCTFLMSLFLETRKREV
ncbi:MAG: hypothetical protein ACTHOF_05295 [Flavisolibacter sp.]|jgi:hypothetical protein